MAPSQWELGKGLSATDLVLFFAFTMAEATYKLQSLFGFSSHFRILLCLASREGKYFITVKRIPQPTTYSGVLVKWADISQSDPPAAVHLNYMYINM